MKRLVVSFSGGETSGLMTYLILSGRLKTEYDEIEIVFANTGEEREETLEFVRDCQNQFGWPVVWVEAQVHEGKRKSNTHRIVNFETATRMNTVDGPFEVSIRKYGIPNMASRDCTRNLKQYPIESYLKSLGWGKDYDLAIGIRADEMDRMSPLQAKRRLIYPLISDVKVTKPMVNEWWRQQPFRLRLKGYEGNCAWCWKKSMRKHITLIRENHHLYTFPHRMEQLYNQIGPEFVKQTEDTLHEPLPPGYSRKFFRGQLTCYDVWEESVRRGDDFVPAEDDHVIYEAFDPALDVGASCEESCEVFGDDYNDEDEERDYDD